MQDFWILVCLSTLLGIANAHAETSLRMDAVREAEAFVLRHGFTAAGHPSDQPIENVSLYDMLSSREELVANRKASVDARAVCVRSRTDGDTVLFRETGQKDRYLFVAINAGERPYVGHQSVGMSADCRSVPQPER